MLRVLDAGCDQFGGEVAPDLVVDLVRDGRLSEERLDVPVRRVLTEKVRSGLFERGSLDVARIPDRVGTPDARAAGLEAQRRSVVVVENRTPPVLPLRADVRVYAEGVDAAVLARYAKVVDDRQDADVALLRIDAPYEPRTEGFEAFFHAGSLGFPGELRDRVAELATRLPIVLDVRLDRAALLRDLSGSVAALTATFGASDEALLDVLFGGAPATGTLPFEIPASDADLATRHPDVPFGTSVPAYPYRHGIPLESTS